MSVRTVLVAQTQVPLAHGGAEIHTEGLLNALRHRGFRADLVTVPFNWAKPVDVLAHAFAWRLLELQEIDGERVDLIIGTRYPSYLVRHPNKVIWLIHQFREVYDLYGTAYSFPIGSVEDLEIRDSIIRSDQIALTEARKIYTNSRNTAERLKRFNNLDGIPLYVPPKLVGKYRCEPAESYILSVGRLDRLKRVDLLIRAMQHVKTKALCVVVGEGKQKRELAEMVAQLGLQDRVHFVGRATDEELVDLYARASAIYYAPYDEDFGLVTVEAFASRKPVLTARDSGGVLELVENNVTGLVCEPTEDAFARAIDQVLERPSWAVGLGTAGLGRVKDVTWDNVLNTLIG
jgi:glycosyltransferase involved in cell wall biosynthesis